MADTGIDTSKAGSGTKAKRRFRWWWIAPAALFVCLLAAGAVAYVERLRIATYVAQRYLAAHGIRSTIAIGRLNWGGVLARVEAGPADAPDFSADSIELSLAYPDTSFSGWTKPQISAVRLVHPVLRVSYDGTKPSFGSLQPLVDEALASPSDAPKPKVTIENGNLLLSTPYGNLDLLADATIVNGRPDRLKASLKRTSLKLGAFAANMATANVTADFVGDDLTASILLNAESLHYEGRVLRGVAADTSFRGLNWTGTLEDLTFKLPALAVALKVTAIESPEATAAESESRIALQTVAGKFAGNRLEASATGMFEATLANLRTGVATVASLSGQSTFSKLMADLSPASASVETTAHIAFRGTDAQHTVLGRTLSLATFAAEIDSSGSLGTNGSKGRAKGVLSLRGTIPRELTLRSLQVNFDGSGDSSAAGTSGFVRGSLTADANMPRAAALEVARAIPGLGTDEAMASAFASALQSAHLRASNVSIGGSTTGFRVESAAPIRLDSMNGASVTLSPRGEIPLVEYRGGESKGALNLDILGGGLPELRLAVPAFRYLPNARNRQANADVQFVTALDYGALRGLHLTGAGKLELLGDRLSFDAPGCTDIALTAYRDGGSDRLRDVKATLCKSRLQTAANGIALDIAGCSDIALRSFGNGGAGLLRDVKTRVCDSQLQVGANRVALDLSGCTDISLASLGSESVDLVRNVKTHWCGASVEVQGSRAQFTLGGCAEFSLESFRNNDAAMVADAKGQLCSVMNRPLAVSDNNGWQIDGRWAQASAQFVPAASAIAAANGTILLAGQAAEIQSGAVTLATGRVSDLTPVPRFLPLLASGGMKASGPDWQGQFLLSSGNSPVATVTVRHSLTAGTGEARIETPSLAFVPKALQPENLAPFLVAFGKDVAGPIDFKGRVGWSKDGMTSDGRLVLSALDLRSPFGMVRQIRGNLELTSLLPVALAPGQSVTVNRVETFVPVEQLSAKFTYTPEALNLEQVSATLAEGRVAVDPMAYRFAPGATNSGTLRLQNVNLTPLLAAAGLADRVAATSRIDGVVPFSMGPEGVRFANGKIAANAPGRLSIKREALSADPGVGGMATVSSNAVQDFAYQALENLAFEQLDGTVSSRPMGRLGVLFHVKGRNDPVKVAETRVGLFDLLRGRGFDKPLPLPKGTPVDLTLDTSVNLDELLNTYFNRTASVLPPGQPAK